LRTLFVRPGLADSIRALEFDLHGTYEDRDVSRDIDNSDVVVGETVWFLTSRSVAPRRIDGHLVRGIARGNSLGYCAMFFLLCKRLDKLDLRVRGSSFFCETVLANLYGTSFSRCPSTELRTLQGSLDTVRILHIPVQHFNIFTFFSLAKLSTLKVDLRESFDGNLSRNQLLPARSNSHGPHRLQIESDWNELETSASIAARHGYSIVLPHLLKALQVTHPLHAPKSNIKIFEMDLMGLKGPESSDRVLTFATLVDSLEVLQDTLEELKVTVGASSPYRVSNYDFRCLQQTSPINSLSNFRALESLEVPQEFLVNSSFERPKQPPLALEEILPASIKRLTVTCPGAKILAWLRQLLHARDSFPGLGYLNLHCMPQRGRLASWFVKRNDPVFHDLRARGVAVSILDVGEPCSPPSCRRSSLSGLDFNGDDRHRYRGIAALFRQESGEDAVGYDSDDTMEYYSDDWRGSQRGSITPV
jgi:hypothetical protein